MTDLRFEGRVAIVTGAGNGLGRAHALLLASRGACVVVNDIDRDADGRGAADLVVDEIRMRGGEAIADDHSVADPISASAIVAAAMSNWGRVDIVINNAGILDMQSFVDADDTFDSLVIDTHLRGAINVTRAAWSPMERQRYGRVVNTSSGAVFGSPVGMAYQSAKAGVLGLTRGLATLGRDAGIEVNALLPTAFTRMTDTIPDPRFREFMATRFTPERVAAFAAVLAHESCRLSGESFLVGGGRVSRLLLAVTHGVVLDDGSPEAFAEQLDTIIDPGDVGYPPDRLTEFQSYLGRLGFGADALDMSDLVRADDSR